MASRALIAALVSLLLLPATAAGSGDWTWPVRGDVLTPFRNGSDPYAAGQHRGIDIAAPAGADVVAAVAGTVRHAGVAGDSGLTVSVRAGDHDVSYLHLSAVSVKEGQTVAAGTRLGAVGTSGRRSTAAPHLHFGVRRAGDRHAYLDPLDFLAPVPAGPREAPRGAPAPVPVPVTPRPQPAPVRGRAPVRVPGGAAGAGAGRPPRPGAGRAGGCAFPGWGRRRAGSRPVPRPRPVVAACRRCGRCLRSAAIRVPPALPGRARARSASASRRATARPSPPAAPEPAPGPAAGGPDLGWALACLGLLAAAACLGRPGRGGDQAGPRRASAPSSGRWCGRWSAGGR